MAKVKITFSGDLKKIGKTVTVTDEEAATLVREGRAQHVVEQPAVEADAAPAAKPTKS